MQGSSLIFDGPDSVLQGNSPRFMFKEQTSRYNVNNPEMPGLA